VSPGDGIVLRMLCDAVVSVAILHIVRYNGPVNADGGGQRYAQPVDTQSAVLFAGRDLARLGYGVSSRFIEPLPATVVVVVANTLFSRAPGRVPQRRLG
jgi:hypothetical protein